MAMTLFGTAVRRWLRMAGERLAHAARLWRDDLLALVPIAQRERGSRALGFRGPLVIEADAVGGYRQVGGSEGPLSPEAVHDRTRARLLALRIDDAQILRRRLGLPPAAAARLEAALEMNLSTWTPFAAAEVYAVAELVEQAPPRPGAPTAIELRCVPRPLVDERIAALRALGLDPDAIELGDARFTLRRMTRKRLGIGRRRWLLTGLALLLLGQGVGAYLVLTSRQREEIEALETARAEMVTALRRRADAEKQARVRREESLGIAARMDEELSVSRALRLLASVLPQDAMIREFELGRDRAEGHVAILGAAGLDPVAILSGTGFYRVGDLSVMPGNDADRKVFSATFAVVPWIRTDGRPAR